MKFTAQEKAMASAANFELSLKYLEAVREGYDVIIEPPKDSIQIAMTPRVLNAGNWGYDFLNLDFVKEQYYDKGIVPDRKILYVVIDTMAYPVHEALIPYSVDKKYCFDHTDDRDGIDGHGHGHHCSGIIMGQVNKYNLGVAHITGHKTKDLFMGQKGLASKGGGSSGWLKNALLKSLDICKTEFPDYTPVFSLSWGSNSKSSIITDAIDEIVRSGGFVCAANGNQGTNNIMWPAAHINVLAMGANDSNGQRSYFSQFGPETFSIGPGRNVWSCYKDRGTYASWSGTSMGTPHVAGMLGHVLKFNPQIKTQQDLVQLVDDKFKDAGEAGRDQEYGYGYPMADYLLKDVSLDDKPNPPEEKPKPPTPKPTPPDTPDEKPEPDKPDVRDKRTLTLDFSGSWDLNWAGRSTTSTNKKPELSFIDHKKASTYNTLTLTDVKISTKTHLYFNDVYDWIDSSIGRAFLRTVLHVPSTWDSYDVALLFGKYLSHKLKQYDITANVKSFEARDMAGRLIKITY